MGENSKIARNTIILYIRMFVVMAVNLYTSRILLKNLGISDFGLYSVVGSVATMFVFLNSAMRSVTQRYLSFEIGKNNFSRLKEIFTTSFYIHLAIGFMVVILCEIGGLIYIYNLMNIPEGRENAVFWTFQITMVLTFFSMIAVPYNALVISRERMEAFAYVSVFDVFCKLAIAYIISISPIDRLIFYSLLMVLSQILVLLFYVLYCRKHFEESNIQTFKYTHLYKEMLVFASWGLLGHFAYIISTSFQDMMINSFFAPVVNAARGIAVKVSAAVTSFSSNFQLSVEPQITISYAEKRIDRTMMLIINSSRFSIYLIWLFTLPIILCANEILSIWLVEVPEYTSAFVKLVLINNVLASTSNALNIAIRANGNIKYPGIVGGIILVLNLPISLFFLYRGFSPLCVFCVSIFCDSLAQISRIYFAKKYIDLPVVEYLKKVFGRPTVIMLISVVIPVFLCKTVYLGNGIIKIIVVGIISVLSIVCSLWFLGVYPEERSMIITWIRKRIKI